MYTNNYKRSKDYYNLVQDIVSLLMERMKNDA